MRLALTNAWSATFAVLVTLPVFAAESLLPRPSGAASDPLAVVTFTDLRVTYHDLEGGSDRAVFSAEGAYVFHPKFKLNYDANYWRTDVTGSNETGWADFRIKPVYFPKTRRWRGLIYRTAVGLDLRVDAGNTDKGIGNGTDQLGVLAGLQLVFSTRRRMSIIAGHRKSFNSEPGRDFRQSELALVGVHSIPSFHAWVAGHLGFLVNHEKEDASTTTVNLQVGHLFTPAIGVHVDTLLPLAGRGLIDHSIRFTLRIRY